MNAETTQTGEILFVRGWMKYKQLEAVLSELFQAEKKSEDTS